MKTLSLNDWLSHICNYCNRHFNGKPIYRDPLKVYAFCSETCADEMEKTVNEIDQERGIDENISSG